MKSFFELEIETHFKRSFAFLQSYKRAQSVQNIQSVSNVKSNLFGPQTWDYVNSFMKALDEGLTKMGTGQNMSGAALNFQTVINNRSQLAGLSGSVKNLANLSAELYDIVTKSQPGPYSLEEAKKMATDFQSEINSMSFTEANGQEVKTSLLNSLNIWANGMGNTQT